jgi:PadR family transcriptional regulator, regulatory protein PadR
MRDGGGLTTGGCPTHSRCLRMSGFLATQSSSNHVSGAVQKPPPVAEREMIGAPGDPALCRFATMGTKPRITAQTIKVLAALMSHTQGEVSGSQIGRTTGLASGTLYPILFRLEEAGWVESRWETEDPHELGRPRRRFYKITGVGASKARSAFREVVLPLQEFAWR